MLIVLVTVLSVILLPALSGSTSGENLTPKDVSLSKSLSWLLRHGAIDEGLRVSEDGFILLEDVLQHRLFARRCAPADIRRVVTLSKNRFTLRANPVTGIYEIRANSGHTFKDQNNEKPKSELKSNRGRTIPQPGLKSGKNNKNNHQSKKQKNIVDDLLKNYNIPVGNIASNENKKRRKSKAYENLMKYPELKKTLLWLLRYGSGKEGLTVKRHGYVPVDEILTHSYFKDKCMREDIITVANNEPHNFKLRESPSTQQLYIRARKEHPIKQEQEDWSVIPDVIYIPLGFVIHGINGSDWDFVSKHGLKVPEGDYLYCSPYYAADSWHTRGVTKYDDIYIHINCHAAMQDGIEFFVTPEYSVTTKGDKEGFIGTQYFKKVILAKNDGYFQETCFTPMEAKTSNIVCEACNVHMHPKVLQNHIDSKKHKFKQGMFDRTHKTVFVSDARGFSPKDLENIFKKYGKISNIKRPSKKPFAFIQFTEKEAVERVLKSRIFAGGKRLFVRKCEDNNARPSPVGDPNKSRKLSETSSNPSTVEYQAELPEGYTGLKELPVLLADLSRWSEGDILLSQALDFISQVELSPEKYLSLNEVKCDVENLFRPIIRNCQVFVFGSCGSQLAFQHSDVDLFLYTDDPQIQQDFVRNEAKVMYRSRQFRLITRIPNARVPIIKFEHLRTGWLGDLTASSQLGVCNSQLIRFLVSLDPRIKPLVMIIKYWAKVCGVSCSYNNNRFTTYSLVMLVVFYLQQLEPPMLPTIAQLQQMSQHKQFSRGWECSFCDEDWRVQSECLSQPNNLTLRQLLTGFFRFYHNLDANNVLCPLLGRFIPVGDFESEDTSLLPDEMLLYKENLKNDPKSKFRTDVKLRVQDPFELCLNITKNVVDRSFSIFKEACKVSLELCEKVEDSVLLERLFSINEDLLDVCEDLKINIMYKEEVSTSSGTAFTKWCLLNKQSIILVLREVYKFDIKLQRDELLNKVMKLESSQDVHNQISTTQGADRSVFVCSGKINVWEGRKKVRRSMNRMNIPLSPFAKEVCISNALFHPRDSQPFTLTMTVSSLEDSKKGEKGLTLKVYVKKCRHDLIRGLLNNLKIEFTEFLLKAQAFIANVSISSPLDEVKESQELFKLKLQNLPDIKKIMMDEEMLEKKVNNAPNEIPKTVPSQQETEKSHQATKEPKPNFENKETNLSIKETKQTIDNFVKPTGHGEASKRSENTDDGKLNNLLNAIQKVETQSTFTSGNVNPFLSSIEKIAVKSLETEKKEDKLYETEDKSVHNESISGEPELPNLVGENAEVSLHEEADPSLVENISSVKNTSSKQVESSSPAGALEADGGIIEQGEAKNEFIIKQNDDTRTTVQNRPLIHSERPIKQRKHNNKNAIQQPRMWVGGGPPGCQQLQKPPTQPQLQAPATSFHRTSTAAGCSIEHQRKWYPGLFKDSN